MEIKKAGTVNTGPAFMIIETKHFNVLSSRLAYRQSPDKQTHEPGPGGPAAAGNYLPLLW